MSELNLSELRVPLDRVYLVSYFMGNKEIEFEKDDSMTSYFLVVGGPPPIKLAKPETGVKVFRIPTDQDPVSFCKVQGGYCCRGKETDYVLKRSTK